MKAGEIVSAILLIDLGWPVAIKPNNINGIDRNFISQFLFQLNMLSIKCHVLPPDKNDPFF